MRIAVVQLAYDDDEAAAARVERVCALVAGLAGHDLVLLPELWPAGGFAYRDWPDRAEGTDGSVAERMSQAARAAGVLLHAGSIVERSAEPGPEGKHLWNTSLLFGPDGQQLAAYRKIHRFGFGEGEPTLMEAGDDVVVVDLEVPSGERFRAGLSTCYDLRFPELYRRQIDAGATVFLVPCCLAGRAGGELGPVHPGPCGGGPVPRPGSEHGGHPRAHAHGRAVQGRPAHG